MAAFIPARLMACALLLAGPGVVRAQNCPPPPENANFSTFEQWKAFCSRYGTPEGTSLYNAHCVYDPNWCHRNNSSSSSSYTPPQPPDNESAFRNAEIARLKIAAAEKARKAEEAKQVREQFEKDKAEAVKDLMGASSDDLALKGDNDASLNGADSSLDLKGISDISSVPKTECTQSGATAALPSLQRRVLGAC